MNLFIEIFSPEMHTSPETATSIEQDRIKTNGLTGSRYSKRGGYVKNKFSHSLFLQVTTQSHC